MVNSIPYYENRRNRFAHITLRHQKSACCILRPALGILTAEKSRHMPESTRRHSMKQKSMLLSALLLALLMLGAGCFNGKVTPTPAVKASPSPNLTTPNPTLTPGANTTSPLTPSASPDVAGGNTIEGFREGETVEVASLPEKVTKAVKDKYPNATIKSATYATYMDDQMYHLMLEGAGENTTEIYAKADGTLLPFNAESTPGTTAGGNGGTNNG